MNRTHAYKLAQLSKTYVGLYQNDDVGLCGVGYDSDGGYVQITEDAFADLVKAYPEVKWILVKTKDKEFPYRATVELWETRFLTIGTRKEFKDVGLL